MSIPWYDSEKTGSMMDFCDYLLTNIPAYGFHFTPDQNAVRYLLDFDEKS
jgi:hypothetical protein